MTGGIAVSSLAEMEVMPHAMTCRTPSPAHQDALDEIVGAQRRQFLVERENHRQIELVERSQQGQLLGQRRQPEMRPSG